MPNIYKRLVDYFSLEPDIDLKSIPPVVQKSVNDELAWVQDGKYYSAILSSYGKAYSTNYIVHRCVSLLASNLSKLTMRVYFDDKPMPIDYILQNGTNRFDIRQPHPRMSLSTLLYQCGVYYWYKGEFMSLIDTENILTLEPINPDNMKIKKAAGTFVDSWTMNYKTPIPADNLIYANVFNPDILDNISDLNRTLSPVKVVENELRNYLSGREFNTQFFKNFAQIGLTLKDVNANATREERAAIVDELDNTIKAGNAWRTKMMPQGVEIADTKTTTMKEMQLNEMFKDLRDIILGVYGVPRSVFGITNEAGLAQNTVDAEKRIMWTDTIQPVAFQIQEAFNQTLMKRYFPGYKLYFDYSDVKVLQDDMVQKASLAKAYRELSYTTNEVNDLLDLGMESINNEALNERFTPINLTPYSVAILEPATNEVKPSKDENAAKEILDILNKENNENEEKISKNKENKEKISKTRGLLSKQLGKVLAIVKEYNSTDKIDKVSMLDTILGLLNQEKDIFKGFECPEKINNIIYFKIKEIVETSVEEKVSMDVLCDRIITLYKFSSSRIKGVIKDAGPKTP